MYPASSAISEKNYVFCKEILLIHHYSHLFINTGCSDDIYTLHPEALELALLSCVPVIICDLSDVICNLDLVLLCLDCICG